MEQTLAEVLAAAMKRKSLTQQDVAEICDVSDSQVNRWLNQLGAAEKPSAYAGLMLVCDMTQAELGEVLINQNIKRYERRHQA